MLLNLSSKLKFLPLMVLLTILASGCASMQRTPVKAGTIPDGKPVSQSDLSQGQQVRAALVQQFPEDRDPKKYERVSRIMARLAHAAGGNALKDPWQITILTGDNIKNAAATSGNFVFVWTGIMLAVQDDHEFATVLGHEIAHVLALHTQPSFAEQLGSVVASGVSIATQTILMRGGVYGGGANAAGNISGGLIKALLVNPYSQKMELEADQVGLFLMAKAGYNPKAAINFWTRLSQDPDFSSSSLSFLSTHPTSKERIEQLSQHLPEAEKLYKNYRSDSFNLSKKPSSVPKVSPQTPAKTTAVAPISSSKLASQPSPQTKKEVATKPVNSTSSLDLWTTRELAQVYQKDSPSSAVVTELPEATKVEIKHELKEWVEIKAPVSGFILKSQVKPAWSKK